MSQSPLARSTRRTLPAFSRTPSRLSNTTSLRDLSQAASSSSDSRLQDSYTTPTKPESNSNSRHRSTATATSTHTPSGSPHTPKIHYSPYATSTPPSALSKSTSIPFDMAASIKAGRKAEQDAKLRTIEPSSGVKRRRLVRKKPLFQRIAEFPEKMYDLAALHYPLTIEHALPPSHFANPTSLVLHGIHWLLLAPLLQRSEQPESVLRSAPPRTGPGSRWDRWEDEGRVKGRGLGGVWTTIVITLLLLLLAAGNSIYLFTRFRTYDMQLRAASDPIPSPHASPVSAPKSQERGTETDDDDDVFGGSKSEEEETAKKKYLRLAGHGLLALSKWSFHALLSVFGRQVQSSDDGFNGNEDKIQSLKVWEPPEFCLAFFCAFPPSAPILSYLLTPLHPFITPFLHLATSFLLSHLAVSYAQLVKDRMVLSAEVMREYDRRFVYKKIFGSRVDRSVQTEQAESLW